MTTEIQTKRVTHEVGPEDQRVSYSVAYFEADEAMDLMFDTIAPLIGEPAAAFSMGMDVAVKALLKHLSSKEVKGLISTCMKYVGEVRDGGTVAPVGKSWPRHFAGRIDTMFELVYAQLEQNYGNTVKKAVDLWAEIGPEEMFQELTAEE